MTFLGTADLVSVLIGMGKCVEKGSFCYRAIAIWPAGKWQRTGTFSPPVHVFLLVLTDNVTLPTQPLSEPGITFLVAHIFLLLLTTARPH